MGLLASSGDGGVESEDVEDGGVIGNEAAECGGVKGDVLRNLEGLEGGVSLEPLVLEREVESEGVSWRGRIAESPASSFAFLRLLKRYINER